MPSSPSQVVNRPSVAPVAATVSWHTVPAPGRHGPIQTRRAAVLIITLLALVPLVAMVLFVFNLSDQVNRRVAAQHAADSAAVAGAGWIARSLNTVSMNNVAVSRQLALINTLDAMPLATKTALAEQTFLRDALRIGSSFQTGSGRLNTIAQHQIALLIDELDQEIDLLDQVDALLRQYDVAQMTHFDGPNGDGMIWRAMRGMDQMSQAAMQNLGSLAQVNAVRGGQVNLPGADPDAAALLVPVRPQLPWVRGKFDDFERPVTMGRLPDPVDHPHTNRGPYDTVFGWRDIVYRHDRDDGGGGGGGTPGGVRSNAPNPFGGGPGAPGNVGPGGTIRTPIGYTTFGTQHWALMRVHRFAYRSRRAFPKPANLEESRFWPWFKTIADTKLGYLWRGTPPHRFSVPDWDTSYPIVPLDAQEPLDFSETAFFRLDIKSRYARRDARFLTDGTWSFQGRWNQTQDPDESMLVIVPVRAPVPARPYTWWLPSYKVDINGRLHTRRMQFPGELDNHFGGINVQKVGRRAWIYEYEYELYADATIGIAPRFTALGRPLRQKAHFIQLVVFGGTNRNRVHPGVHDASDLAGALNPIVADPYEGFDRTDDEAPAPVNFDHDQIDSGTLLTYLGIARIGDKGPAWPRQFRSGAPYPALVAIAEAHVFNNHSWDMWTQMWHAQLRPVQDYDLWLDRMSASIDDAAASPVVSEQDLDRLHQYLASIESAGDVMLGH